MQTSEIQPKRTMALLKRVLPAAVVLVSTEAAVELPDVVGDAEAVSHALPPTVFVTAPPKFLPSVQEIRDMPAALASGRTHFYISALALVYISVLMLGTFLLWLGTKCKNRGVDEPQRILMTVAADHDDTPELPPAKAGLSRRQDHQVCEFR